MFISCRPQPIFGPYVGINLALSQSATMYDFLLFGILGLQRPGALHPIASKGPHERPRTPERCPRESQESPPKAKILTNLAPERPERVPREPPNAKILKQPGADPYTHVHICTYMYTNLHTYVYPHTFAYIHTYIHTYIHMQLSLSLFLFPLFQAPLSGPVTFEAAPLSGPPTSRRWRGEGRGRARGNPKTAPSCPQHY